MRPHELPLPAHFAPDKVSQVWPVSYQALAGSAEKWAAAHGIPPGRQDAFQTLLLLVDVQNTFCIPGYELFVGGASGSGAVEDNQRLCVFIYRNLHRISQVCVTLDTHQAVQIFHSIFWVNAQGEHPPPLTSITPEDVSAGVWRVNPQIVPGLGVGEEEANQYAKYYTARLKDGGKYDLTIWPYHAMQAGIGHALVSAVEEAVFFHGIVRRRPPMFQAKGDHPLTESYSVLQPEIREDARGRPLASAPVELLDKILGADACVIAGQAKSHCVAWTIDDLLTEIRRREPSLAEKIYLLEDCTSPVVIPGVVDYTETADAAFRRFADAGMGVVRSSEAMAAWPGPMGSTRIDE